MKILYLADIRFPMERANGIQTAETAHALARRGVSVELVVRRTDARSDGACLEFFGLSPHPGLQLRRVPARFGRWSYLGAALSAVLAQRRWDVLYTRDLVIADLALRLRRFHPMPVVYEAHTVAAVFAAERAHLYASEPAPGARRLGRLDERERRVCRSSSGIVAITAGLRDALQERHGPLAASRVIPDGTRVPEKMPAYGGPHAPPRVYYIGQLYPWKGADLLVEAMRFLESCELVVVGGLPPEPDLDRIRKRAADLGVEDRVRFKGFVPPSGVAAERAQADVFVIPLLDSTTARLYTSPLKLFEAMASGRPIVASDLPSIREVLQHEENALLVPPGDARSLAAAIERLVSDPVLSRRLSTKAFDDVKSYSWDRRAEALESFLTQLRK